MTAERNALVFGASGISGWATVRELLRYPTTTTFSRVTALTNRPLPADAILLDDPRLRFKHAVDLTQPIDTVVRVLKDTVPDIDLVTHVYFYCGFLRSFLYYVALSTDQL